MFSKRTFNILRFRTAIMEYGYCSLFSWDFRHNCLRHSGQYSTWNFYFYIIYISSIWIILSIRLVEKNFFTSNQLFDEDESSNNFIERAIQAIDIAFIALITIVV